MPSNIPYNSGLQRSFLQAWLHSYAHKFLLTTRINLKIPMLLRLTFKRPSTLYSTHPWPLFSYLLHNIEVKVRIGPLKSRCVTLNQGVGQGRIPSTSQYKLHLDRLLSTLESSGLGSHIGPFYCGAPTCADDVLLVADSHNELQAQLDIIGHYSRQERYMINPTKTTVSVYPSKRSPTPGAQHKWKLNDEEVAPTEHFAHLGINRSAGKLSPEVLINTRLQLARNTRYALMGAGLHGSNGISPAVCTLHIFSHALYSTWKY